MLSKSFTQLMNSRLLAVLLLGFASGLPLALTGSTLQAWFTAAHVDLMTIGALTLLGIPYTLKFIWAPLMDHYGFPIGKRKGWILITQFGLVIALLWLARMQPETQASAMGILALIIAFFSASQDVSVTAYQTDVLYPTERGMGAAYFVFAYRIAALLSGGLALIFADYFGWFATYQFMAVLMLINMLLTCRIPRISEPPLPTKYIWQTTIAAIGNLFQREHIIWLLLFIACYKIGDAFALSLMTNFLLNGLGFSLTEIGIAYKAVSFIASILGVFLGGIMLTRLHIYRALLLFGLAQAFSNLTFVILAYVGKHFVLMTSAMFIENFCSGLSTAALLAFMMSLCEHRYTATQFALLSTFASLGRVYLGPLAAFVVAHYGWMQFYFWAFLISFPSLMILSLLKTRVTPHVSAATD